MRERGTERGTESLDFEGKIKNFHSSLQVHNRV